MKKIEKILLGLLFVFVSAAAQAAPVKILFFYPGGEGSQEAAQPLLDGFAEALKKVSGGKLEPSVTYMADKAAGLEFIKTQKPAVAVLSLDTYYQYAPTWGATMIAKTLQLPSGDGSDQYFLIGKKGAVLPASGAITLSSRRPLDPNFLTGKLFPQFKTLTPTIQTLRNPIGALRAVGSGEKSDFILLDQFEWANVSRLKAAWVAGLGVVAESQKISSAPVIAFPGVLNAELSTVLQQALVKIGQDASAQPTLQELRMKGFKAATSPD